MDPHPNSDLGVVDLLAKMTLEEKSAQVMCPLVLAAPERRLPLTETGMGGAAYPLSATELAGPEGRAAVNALQTRFVEETRLGIPALFNEEALCGLRVKGATMGPDAIGQAATWNPSLVEQLAGAYGKHMRATGIRQALSPLCDVAVDPRWGRIEETYGEDPYLVGCMATAFVLGLQQPGNVATLKHFIGYSASDGGRNTDVSRIGPVDLHEVYGLPFEMAIRLGRARAVMCSYQAIDRIPVQRSRELLSDLLRTEYGFTGILISDLGSVEQLHTRYRVASDRQEALALAFQAGLDFELCFIADETIMLQAVASGKLPEATVDRAVGNVLRAKAELGLFDSPYADESNDCNLDMQDDRELALEVARQSIVLLRNDPVSGQPLLPLTRSVRSVAVIGPNADRALGLLGNYNYVVLGSAIERQNIGVIDAGRRMSQDRHGSETAVDPTMAEPCIESVPVVTVLDGLRRLAGDDLEIHYAQGCSISLADRSGISDAAALARSCDIAVVVVGDQSGLFTHATVGEGVDGGSLELPGLQRELVESVIATGTPTVVVLTHGRPYVLDWLKAPAVLTAWFPGEEGGTAIAEALLGQVNPSGKLPASFPSHVGALPAPYFRAALGGNTYFDIGIDAIFPFGHGLSYTTFEYSDLTLDPQATTDGTFTASVTVRNAGTVVGAEVVQLYLRDPVARTVRPHRELKGFCKLELAVGESARVCFELSADRCALFDPEEGWVVEPGDVEIMVGASSADIRLSGTVRLTGAVRHAGADRQLMTSVRISEASELTTTET